MLTRWNGRGDPLPTRQSARKLNVASGRKSPVDPLRRPQKSCVKTDVHGYLPVTTPLSTIADGSSKTNPPPVDPAVAAAARTATSTARTLGRVTIAAGGLT